ncbi:MAG: hypothetical protein WC254_01695 [Candidatus Woesearchaeota archaeon]|jgi:hypothetical protein
MKIKEMQIKSWLLNSNIRGSNGEVYSWVNSNHSGYVYNEIIGYYISYLTILYKKEMDQTRKKYFIEKAINSTTYLKQQSVQGGLGREEILYAFDTGICLTGLLRLKEISLTWGKELDMCINELASFLLLYLNQKKAAINKETNKEVFDKEKWSLSYGSLLIKMAIPLYLLYESTNDLMYKNKAIALCQELISLCFKEDHFCINSYSSKVYTHPHCYAIEGLLFLKEKGISNFDHIIIRAAEWLAKQQNSDGSLYSWYYHTEIEKIKNGDCSAQAVRIWLAVDKKKYKKNIESGFQFLSTLQSKEGGLYYNSLSKDINSWVSLFAWQAYDWTINGVYVSQII